MKKKVLLFVMMIMAGVLLVPSALVNALDDSHSINGSFYGNGKKVVISERTDGQAGAHIECDGNSYDVGPTYNVYGGRWDPNNQLADASVASSEIVMNGGTVAAIYGGGMGSKAHVGSAKITINGGNVGYTQNIVGTEINYGGFVYGGSGSLGGTVNNVEIIYNGGKVKNAIIASGAYGYVGNAVVTVNAGSPIVAHAIENARVGTAKIVINENSKYPQVYEGYYWQGDYYKKSSYVDNLEVEVWGGKQVNVVPTAVLDGSNLVSANTKTKYSYRKGVDIKYVEYGYGKAIAAKEVIPYIQLNVKLGNEAVKSAVVPQGKLDQELVKSLTNEVLTTADKTADDFIGLFLDEEFKKEYTADTAVATGINDVEANLYIKLAKSYTLKFVYEDDEVYEVSKTFREDHVITEDEIEALKTELREKAKLADDVELSFYSDKEMKEELKSVDSMLNEDLTMSEDVTIYVNKVNLRVDDEEDNNDADKEDEEQGDVNFSQEIEEGPNTADINLIAILGTMAVAGLGLGYTIKKRKFN